MNILDNTGIGWSVKASFTLITLLLIFFGIYTITEMRTLGELTATLYEHPLRVSNAALAAQGGVVRIHRDMKDVVLSEDPEDLQRTLQKVDEEERRVFSNLETVREYILGQAGMELVLEATETFSAWRAIRDRVVFLMRSGKRADAIKITRTIGADHVRLLEQRMQALTNYARNKADGFMADARRVQKRIDTQTILVLAVIALLMGGFWLAIRHSTSRLTLFRDTLTTMATTDELAEVDIPGQNEIADLGATFNRLVRNLRRQLWARDGLALLNEALMAVKELDDFNGTLSFLARRTNASAAALFSHDSVTDHLNRIAAYALPEALTDRKKLRLGQGISGQAAKDRQPIYQVGNPDNLMECEGGTGTSKAKAVLAVPLVFKNELVGVAEFAFRAEVTQAEREFLALAGNFMAGAILTVTNRMEIDRLFAEASTTNQMLSEKSRELEEVNETLSERNTALAAQSDELENKTKELSDIAGRLSEQKLQLDIKRKQAEEADKLKSEFLSNMSHELRTPLNSILALSQLMLRRKKPSTEAEKKDAEYLTVIERNGRHLLELINNILDLSKIEAGRATLLMEEFSPASVINEVLNITTPLARDKGLDINATLAFTGNITSDRGKVMQVLLNLVSNAVKFTEAGGVELRLIADEENVHFRVMDTGIGIPADLMESVFDKFKQVDGSTTRQYDGSGLGLTISREFARLMGGDLKVESVQGTGSCFVMSLPLKMRTDHAAIPPTATVLETVPATEAVKPARENKLSSPKNVKSATILAVEDNEANVMVLKEVLAETPWPLLVAMDGEQGVEMARAHHPDLILMDVHLPGISGIDATRQLKADPATEDIPIIALTARSMAGDREEFLKAGCDGYLAKPYDPDVLIEQVSHWLS